MKSALITGVAGFVGSHLAEYLLSKNIALTGIIHPSHHLKNIEHLKDKVILIKCDIKDKSILQEKLKSTDFNYVFHLAAFSSPSQSFENPAETLKNNIVSQINLLEVLKDAKSKARTLIIGSADEYGNVPENNNPVDEETPLNPLSPYAVSKVAQDLLGYQYFLHHKLNIVRVRPFNHTGPRQSRAFVVPAYASQIALAEKKKLRIMRVGDLNTYRDLTDVRDIVRAYLLALEKGKVGDVYNIGSGKAYKIQDLLNKLLSLSKSKIKVVLDKTLLRKTDNRKIVCNYTKFRKQTGWKPHITIDKTLSDTIEYERSKLKPQIPSTK